MTENFEIPRDWTFRNQSVVAAFDRHVREQLPFYELVAGAVAHIARHYLPENGTLYDIGASTGNMTALLAETITTRNINTISIDNAEEMRTNFRGTGELTIADATTFDFQPFDVAILFLTIMFIPVHKRAELLETLQQKARTGGAIIIIDKIADHSDYVGTIMRRMTIAGKVASGTNPKEILDKELSLGGIQRPIKLNLLPKQSELFFRWGEFAGWIIETP
jgi:tRNA (cmo5U34)-methyltransferase